MHRFGIVRQKRGLSPFDSGKERRPHHLQSSRAPDETGSPRTTKHVVGIIIILVHLGAIARSKPKKESRSAATKACSVFTWRSPVVGGTWETTRSTYGQTSRREQPPCARTAVMCASGKLRLSSRKKGVQSTTSPNRVQLNHQNPANRLASPDRSRASVGRARYAEKQHQRAAETTENRCPHIRLSSMN